MKTEISRDSLQLDKRYSGVYQQQGRMLTDADWNELVDILKQRLTSALEDVVGNKRGSIGGTPRHRALRIVSAAAGTFKIQPGFVYADGVAAQLPGDGDLDFDDQADFPTSLNPSGSYRLYADIWERTVTHLFDERLLDQALHGADTCTRKQTMVQVKWCPVAIDPEQSDKNPAKGNAQLSVTLLPKSTLPDPCDPCAERLEIESRVGNYLFRVEVHAVTGDADNPTGLVLKWSRENAAEQFFAGSEPEPFKGPKWAYEFFDETGEKQLGVQLATGFAASRDGLHKGYPGAIPARSFVRRWDGFCELAFSAGSWSVVDEFDGSQAGSGSVSFSGISAGQLSVNLDALKLDLGLNHSFIVGDYWLAEVREATYDDSDPETGKLLVKQPPQGIDHRYLMLGEVVADVLQDNAEADRKYAFPALTEMTRLFMAGGDGQEVVPGAALPQALRAGVANGEWPVEGATVRFVIEEGGGSLNLVDGGKTNPQGIAACEWSPDAVIGARCRVKASLVNPDDSADAAQDFTPPVFFYANLITADQVAYVAECADSGANTIHSHLAGDAAVSLELGADGYYNVKEVLDALICSLRASHIPYDEPACAGAPTVKSLLADLDFNGDTHLTVADILDTLLCRLQAQHVPYDPLPKDARWADINDSASRPTTVQEAIDDLAENLESTDIRYEAHSCETEPSVRSGLDIDPGTYSVDQILDKLLCEFKATDLPLDRSPGVDLCSHLKGDASVTTVQDAINVLCRMDRTGGGCAVTVGKDGDFASLEEAFASSRLSSELQISICLLPGVHEVKALGVAGKNSVAISGQGANLLLRQQMALEADSISLNGINVAIVDGDSEEARGSGHIFLASPTNGKVVVQNCSFARTFFGSSKWQPMVTVAGSTNLTWTDNHMYAVRQHEQRIKVLPDESAVAADSQAALKELQAVLMMDPYADSRAFDEKVQETAKVLSALDFDVRGEWFENRPQGSIDRLAKKPVRVSMTGPPLAIDARTAIGGLTVTRISPQDEVNRFYGLLNIDGPLKAEEMAAAIKNLAILISNIDYALVLESNRVGGWISNNDISGYVGLHFGQADAVQITWPPTDSDQAQANKKQLVDKLQPENWDAQQQLNLQSNRISAVHSMLPKAELKAISDALKGTSGATNLKLPSYESTLVDGNIFYEDENSFLGRFLQLNGNQFLMMDDSAVDYALAFSAIFMGGQAYYRSARLEQITRDMELAANMQTIV